jgi:4-amino-4-deoxy-L-arabinose transferase-like glycosyltransferase
VKVKPTTLRPGNLPIANGGALAVIPLLLAMVVFFHLVGISSVPQGLNIDESVIGYNAGLIAQNGRDEHGHLFPLYFHGGNYPPIYVYTVAAAFALFGPSTFVLRATSAFFFGLFLSAVALLAYRRDKSKYMVVFVLLAGGFLPWFFTLSRNSHEVISYVSVMAWVVYCQFIAFHDPSTKNRELPATLCGAFLGLAVYAYPTGRVTSFLYLAVLLAIAASRHLWRLLAMLLAAFTAAIIPYVVYAFTYPSKLIGRFKSITYVFDDNVGLMQKLMLFIENYSSHFGLKFLLLHGDNNLRHATGQGGEVFFSVFFLAVLAIGWLISDGRWRKETFILSLCGGLIIAPTAAALTNAGIPHALRSSLMGLFILLLSCEGLRVLLRRVPPPRILILSVLAILALESAIYLRGYFTDYVPKSRKAFGSYALEESILRALAWSPSAITTDKYLYTKFYEIALPNPKRIPIDRGPMTPVPGRCLVYQSKDWPSLATSTIPSTDLSVPGSLVGVRCFSR